ncbi:MAG: hypothetical protein ACKVIR_07390 [Candidatus Poseidoniales archaeon]
MNYLKFILLGICLNSIQFGQGTDYAGPDDPAGDIEAEREGYMNGNRVYLYYRNTTELSDWPKPNVSKWPNNPDGTKMLDGVGLLVGARVYIEDDLNSATVDTLPITNLYSLQNKNYHTLYYMQTSYREEMDTDPSGQVEWGFYPVFGYFNENSEYPALSTLPDSWPNAGWPSAEGPIWANEWNGRFGRGITYADLETFFVVNDAHDLEYLGNDDMVKYFPRYSSKVIDENTSIQGGSPWGGLGIRVETRGFQWNNPQARDAIFWEYNISNTSKYDLPEVCFGYWVDNAIGGDGADDEIGYFNNLFDMSYSWDENGVGIAGLLPGIMGFAYLESPGLAYDGIDNDDDGIIDEKRDNVANVFVGPYDGIDDVSKFLEYYKISSAELKSHWDADEDQDWEDGEDTNENGIYDANENPGNDVGLDGVGPLEINYTGPDEGEGNHRPDYVESVGCEPNFAATDVTESDMVGLTSFQLFPIFDQHPAPPGSPWFRNDDVMWDLVSADSLIEYYGTVANLVELFASGPFPLYQGKTERISMAEIHSYDPFEGLNSSNHNAPALFKLKTIVQTIYEKDYRFAQPPKTPTISATAGDGYVMLTWDDDADKLTRDPFLGNINDFEGYKLFRSTDKYFSDSEVITDGYGTPMFLKPIFQCDLIDEYSGFTEYGLVNGASYNLGDNTGIQHFYKDENVQNGRTYYYAIVAYDYGAPDIGPGIAPSENNTVIDIDEFDNIRGAGKNVAIVTPKTNAAGYVDPTISIDSLKNNILGTGIIEPNIASRSELKPGNEYIITFDFDTAYNELNRPIYFSNPGYSVFNKTTGQIVYKENSIDELNPNRTNFPGKNLIYNESTDTWSLNNIVLSDVFEGLQLKISQNSTIPTLDSLNTGWITTNLGDINITISSRESKLIPWDCEIVFTSGTSYTSQVESPLNIYDEFDNRLWFPNRIILGQSFPFYVINKSILDENGNYTLMDLVVQDYQGSSWGLDQEFNIQNDRILVGQVDSLNKWQGTSFIMDFFNIDSIDYPKTGSRYAISWERNFWDTDTFQFSLDSFENISPEKISSDLKKVRVVPNPYVGTNAMEEAVINPYLNQPRKVMFTNIPSKCEITIFTPSGVKVKTISVNNDYNSDDGIVHWDLLNEEGLEIAAGMYLFHLKPNFSDNVLNRKEVIGKFAIIK